MFELNGKNQTGAGRSKGGGEQPSSPSLPSRSRTLVLLISLLLILSALIAYWQVQDHPFTSFDDEMYVTNNPPVREGISLRGILWAFTTTHAGNWHPLTWLSHMLDVELFGLNPGGHHLTNLLLHVVNTLLLFLVLLRMTGALWQSAFVAACFGLHPLHVESVAWVAERKDVLSTLFWLVTLWAYIRYTEKPRLTRYFLVVVSFVLGLLSKPMLVTLPFVLLLLDYWPLRRLQLSSAAETGQPDSSVPRRGEQTHPVSYLLLEKLPLFLFTAGSCFLTLMAQSQSGALGSLERLAIGSRIANALVSYVSYIGKMFWPSGLAVLYPHSIDIPLGQAVGAGLLLLAVSTFVLRMARKSSPLIVGWLWYLGTLVPVIGLVQVGVQTRADRYTYVPLIGLFLMIAFGIPGILPRGRHRDTILGIAGVLAVSVLMVLTRAQVGFWKNDVTLYEHTLRVTTNNAVVHNNLGVVLARVRRDEEALPRYQEALRINPNYADAHHNLGALFARQGNTGEATAQFREALRLQPNKIETHNALGVLLVQQGNEEEARVHFTKVLGVHPRDAEAHHHLGKLFFRKGKMREAIDHFREALNVRPGDDKLHTDLGAALIREGRPQEAFAHLSRALEINPTSAEAHHNLGVLLLHQGKNQEALPHLAEALRANPQDAQVHYFLGVVFIRLQRPDEAVSHLSEALRINPGSGEAHLALGLAYLGMGQKALVLKEYETLKRLHPDLAKILGEKLLKARD